MAPVSKRAERFIPNLESGVSEPVKRQDWKQPLYFLGALSLGIRKTLESCLEG